MRWLICSTEAFSREEYDAVYDSLSDSRRAHIDRFRHPDARRQSLAGELALRRLLAEMGVAAVPVRLPSGQPALAGSHLHVSISHSRELVACCVSSRPVGIDIEWLRPVKAGMAEKICTPEELAYVGQDTVRFFEVWTAKEAWFKMQGTGITDFRAVNTLTLPRHTIRQGDYLAQIVCGG